MVLTDSLVSYYKLEDATDSVGSYDGTVSGASTTTDGKINGAYDFDGVNDYISISSSVMQSTAFSISFWEYSSSSATADEGYLIGDSTDPGNLFMRRNTGGTIISTGVGEAGYAGFTLSRDVWHHFVLTHDGSGNVEVYVDTVSEYSFSGSNWTGLTSALYLGNRQDLTRDFEGKLDEVGIWSKVLTSTEITELYNSGTGMTYDTVSDTFISGDDMRISNILYWKLDTNGTVTDATGNYSTATINGASYNATGKINGCYDFTTNDYISEGAISEDLYSIAFWMKSSNVVSKPVMQFESADRAGVWQGNFTAGVGNESLSLLSAWDSANEFSYITTSQVTFSTGTWYHIVFVWDSSNSRYDCYVNGTKYTMSAYGVHAKLLDDTTLFEIGRGNKSGSYFEGALDEVALWNRSLTSDEVTELYNSGDGLQYPYEETPSGWSNTINGISSYSKINGIAVASIVKVNGI